MRKTDQSTLLTGSFTRRGCSHHTESPYELLELLFRDAPPPEEHRLGGTKLATVHCRGAEAMGRSAYSPRDGLMGFPSYLIRSISSGDARLGVGGLSPHENMKPISTVTSETRASSRPPQCDITSHQSQEGKQMMGVDIGSYELIISRSRRRPQNGSVQGTHFWSSTVRPAAGGMLLHSRMQNISHYYHGRELYRSVPTVTLLSKHYRGEVDDCE